MEAVLIWLGFGLLSAGGFGELSRGLSCFRGLDRKTRMLLLVLIFLAGPTIMLLYGAAIVGLFVLMPFALVFGGILEALGKSTG